MLIYWNKRKHLHDKDFNSQRIFWLHQHGRRFIVLEHQYGRHDVMSYPIYMSYPTRTRGIIVKYYREKDMAPPSIRETMGFEIQIRDICTPDTSKEGFRYMEDTISGYHYPFRTATYRVRFIF